MHSSRCKVVIENGGSPVTGRRGALRGLTVRIGRMTMARRDASRVVVLCYHSIHPSKQFAEPPDLFEAHLWWLREHCDVIRFREALPAAARPLGGRPAVAVTFDDGYADNYEYAFPLLRRDGIPATFFLTIGLMERDPAVAAWFKEMRRADDEGVRPLTWDHVGEMRTAGMEFGAHTYSHPNLARVDRARVETELGRSKEIMERRTGDRITLMAYPYGTPRRSFTAETTALASRAGYEYAAAVTFRPVRTSDSPWGIPRFSDLRRDVGSLRDMVLGAWDLVGAWQERAPLALQRRGPKGEG